MPDPVTITGSGTVQTPLAVPDGAQSVRIDVACSSGFVIVDSGADVGSGVGGQCGGVYHFTLALPDRPTAQIRIAASTPPTGAPEPFAATVTFSADPKVVDAALTADCDDLSSVYSAIANAEANYDQAHDPQGWAETVGVGVSELEAMNPTQLLEPQVAALHDWLAAVTEPGTLYETMPDAVLDAQSIIGQLCSDNGSIIAVKPGATANSPASTR
jgi:hypothetical protein